MCHEAGVKGDMGAATAGGGGVFSCPHPHLSSTRSGCSLAAWTRGRWGGSPELPLPRFADFPAVSMDCWYWGPSRLSLFLPLPS